MATSKLGRYLVIVGPTASGKSSLGLELAKLMDGEIVCADSATVRRDMNIGTGKPTSAERKTIPHHLLDVVNPDERYSAADFKQSAEQAISDITKRGKLPIVVGGTGLYIDALIYDYQFGGKGRLDDRNSINQNAAIIGLKIDKNELTLNITNRVDQMLIDGLEHEVSGLIERFGWGAIGMKNVGYWQWRDYFIGTNNLEKTHTLIVAATKSLAKRQTTWFKRNNSIHWINTTVNIVDTVELVTTLLNK